MAKKVVALVGSYRKGGVVDSLTDEVLAAARARGAEVVKVFLMDKKIEFCTNCRSCTQTEGVEPAPCVQKDDMDGILDMVEKADALIIASPVNYYNITAVMRKFEERLVRFAYWPWGKSIPKMRSREAKKRAVLITASAAPSFIGRLSYGTIPALKVIAKTLGARPVRTLYAGIVALQPREELPERMKRKAARAAYTLLR